jgi:hypothetical protein
MKSLKTSAKTILLIMALATALLSLGGSALASRQAANGSFIAIQVVYKLDPRLTGGVHMGERWVSPPIYDIISDRSKYTIEARVEGIAADGSRTVIAAEWTAADQNLVTVKPTYDNMVSIHITGQGNTSLQISAGGFAKTLDLAATYQASQCTNLRVILSQTSQPSVPAQTCRVLIPMLTR